MPPFSHLLLLAILNIALVSSKNSSDHQALKAIKHELLDSHGFLHTWNDTNPCSFWAGIKCLNNQVVSIQLPWRGLGGHLSHHLGELQSLRRLSLHDNLLTGPIPPSLFLLPNLRALYLFNNRISGSIPPSIVNCLNLQSLDLSNNSINGSITSGLSSLTRLYRINLSHNLIVGNLPYELGNLSKLVFLDVSYNNLSGSIPVLLAEKFNSSSFLGNPHLCGYINSTKCSSPSPSPRLITSSRLSSKDIILIASGGALLVVLLFVCCVLLCCVFRRKNSAKTENTTKAVPAVVGGEVGGRLVHFDGSFVFTADDLLSATAEVMGKSVYGTAYKATLEDGRGDSRNEVAVKRLKEKISKPRKEFEIEIARLGEIRHPNILALRAYYLGPKGEKLLVYDYMTNGSLATFLHARGPETVIPWSTRLKVVIGTTRGLWYLHEHENTVHGNLTSTNILLDEEINPKIGDVGLYRLMMDSGDTEAQSSHYRAPEVMKSKNVTVKSDVYSLGVVILEVLTGKSPSEADEGCNLGEWVAENVEEWSSEVFDVELIRDVCSGDELMKVLRLGLCCVDPLASARPEAKEVLEKLEEIEPGPVGVSGGVLEIEGEEV